MTSAHIDPRHHLGRPTYKPTPLGDGRWAVALETWFIDRDGEKDCVLDLIDQGDHETEAAAQAVADHLNGRTNR